MSRVEGIPAILMSQVLAWLNLLAGTGRSQGLPLWEMFGARGHGTMKFGSNQSFPHRPVRVIAPHERPPNVTLDVCTVQGES
jgi:hypothetical protein